MLGGVCTAWLVLVAPSPDLPLDPFAAGSAGPSEAAVAGDLVDPFARPRAPSHEVVATDRRASLDLKDPFAEPTTAGRREATRGSGHPDLADPFARGSVVPVDDVPCPAPRASNGATVQRPEGVAPSRCGPVPERGRPHLRNPFT